MKDWHLLVLGLLGLAMVAYWFLSKPRSPAPKPLEADGRRQDGRAQAGPKAAASPPPSRRDSSEASAATGLDSDQRILPNLGFEEDEDVDPTRIGKVAAETSHPPTSKIVYDEDAVIDEPTQPNALIAVSAVGQTDKGPRRKRNEDSVLVREDQGLFVVADGMGGYRGGELASQLAVATIEEAFNTRSFVGPPLDSIPVRASELARAIQMANTAIRQKASEDRRLDGMGTTVSAARFSPNKQRLYIGHVGDSRVYCLRDGKLRQMTSDHTMADLGVGGANAAHLSRAVGVWPSVPIDIILGKPRAGDVYLICSDGLTKMVSDVEIERVLQNAQPQTAVEALIGAANDHGGNDNVTIVVIQITEPTNAAA